MSCLEHDEHYIVTFPNGYGRLVCLTADLCNGSTDSCSVMVWGWEEREMKDEMGGKDRGKGWRERAKWRMKRGRIFIGNFLSFLALSGPGPV